MNDPIREAFERICVPSFVLDPNTGPARKPDGEYVISLLEDHWQTFQEGWEASTESAVKVLDALDKVNDITYCENCGAEMIPPASCYGCDRNNYLKTHFDEMIRKDARCTTEGWVPEEVIEEVKKYMKNNPTGDMLSQIESAFFKTAHE
jgi:hypothetical protein